MSDHKIYELDEIGVSTGLSLWVAPFAEHNGSINICGGWGIWFIQHRNDAQQYSSAREVEC